MSESSTDRALLRKQLLDNGYRPLPLLDKGIRIKGWSRDEITLEWLAKYERNGRYLNTGIRCDDLIAFDIDVLDLKLADQCEELIDEKCGYTDLCRVGRWPKRLLLYRLEGSMDKSARTGKYGGHQVELLTTHGRQFAAYGIHPGTGKAYEWLDDNSPLNTPFDKLPAIAVDRAYDALDALDTLLEATGLARTTPGGRTDIQGANVYDLTDDTELQLNDGADVVWGDLKPTLDGRGAFGNLLREDGEFGDSDAVHFFIAKGSGLPCVHDFARDCTHWEPEVSPDLAAALPDTGVHFPAPDMFTDKALVAMLDDYVLLADRTVRHIDHPEEYFKYEGFSLINAHLNVAIPTTANPMLTEPLVTHWKKHPATLRADKASLRPDRPDDAIVYDGKLRVFNTYNPPVHDTKGGEVETLNEFVEHLIPKAFERELFLDWHALKLVNPGWRMHCLIMVTPTFGTGRGTWTQIIQRLFGLYYVNEIPLSQLVGTGGQSDFNEYLANSLIVTVPEALEERDDQSKWTARHLAYERLKLVADPVSQRIQVRRKYGLNTIEWTYASLLISSNHVDALAIEPGDRRIIVIDNCELSLLEAPNGLYDRIQAWKDRPENIAALYRALNARVLSGIAYKPFGRPPDTAAKTRMLEAAQSETDRLYEMFIEDAAGDIVTAAQWRMFAHGARINTDLDLPTGDRLDAALTAVITKRARRIEGIPSTGIKIKKSVVRPWVIRRFSEWIGTKDRDKIRAEILKNGDVGGQIIEFK